MKIRIAAQFAILMTTTILHGQTFTRVTVGSIATDGGSSYGASWGDYDGDGDLDLFVANGGDEPNSLYHNNGNGAFTRNRVFPVTTDLEWSHSGTWADYDNDGDLDLFVGNEGGDDGVELNSLYQNNGNGSFTKITSSAIAWDYGVFSNGTWGDYDNDGNLDLYVANFGSSVLYRNLGDGTFEPDWDALPYSWGSSLSGAWADYDNDGDLDLYVANGYGNEADELYSNNGDRTFERIYSSPITAASLDSRGGSWGDYDNDGDLDLFVATGNDGLNFLFRNEGDGSFTEITTGEIVTVPFDATGAGWADTDNDGFLDLVVNSGGIAYFYHNLGDGTFADASNIGGDYEDGLQGMSWGDFDNDGDLDFYGANDGPVNSFLSNDGNSNHWINITAIGQASNTSAIGAKIRLKAALDGVESVWQLREIAAQTGFQSQNSLNVEFGLRTATSIDSIVVEWPSGLVQEMSGVGIDQFLTITEIVVPGIAVAPDTLDFGPAYIGFPDSLSVLVHNNGFGQLDVSNIVATGTGFTVNTTPFSLQYGESHSIDVILETASIQTYSGSLTITSNDADNPTSTVILTGDGLLAPNIVATPNSWSDTILTGAKQTYVLTIENSGDSDLEWTVDVESDEFGTVNFSKPDSADWTLEQYQDKVSPSVTITRAHRQGIFNIAAENGYNNDSPTGTEWAAGYSANLSPIDYVPWRGAVNSSPPSMVDKPVSMHVIAEDIYFDMVFHNWTSGNRGGGFSYTRTFADPSWLVSAIDSGTTVATGTVSITLSIDALGLDPGAHQAQVVVRSNDPDQSVISIPFNLEITGAPDIYAELDTVQFGEQFVSTVDTLLLEISNKGSDALYITSAATTPAEYSVFPPVSALEPGENEYFSVVFAPTALGDHSGSITFISNDPDEGTFIIPLAGRSVLPPIVDVVTDSLTAELITNDTMVHVISLGNIAVSGASDLIYELRAVQTGTTLGSPSSAPAIRMSKSISPSRPVPDLREILRLEMPQPNSDMAAGTPQSVMNQTVNYESVVWSPLYSDADEPELAVDIGTIYSGMTQDEVLFKIEYNGSLGNLNGLFQVIALDIDQDTSTGLNIDEFSPYGWHLGIDHIVQISWDSGNQFVGLFEYSESGNGGVWIEIDSLTTANVDVINNELVIGINSSHYEGISEMNMAIESSTDGTDLVPDMGLGHFTYPLRPRWVQLSNRSGAVPATSREDITLTFDATDLFGGDYFADLSILSNDPVNSVTTIPLRISVTGIPIYAGPDGVNFDESFVAYTDSVIIVLENTGTDILEITGMVSGDPQLTLSASAVSLLPMSVDSVVAYMLATSTGEIATNIQFTTNDADAPSVSIPVTSSAIMPPIISVAPIAIAFSDSVDGASFSDTIRIANSGGSDLIWYVTTSHPDAIPVTFTKEDYADPTAPENQDRISETLWLTRGDNQGFYNASTEISYVYGSPENTEWAYGNSADRNNLNYEPWVNAIGNYALGMVGRELSMHILSEDRYFDIEVQSWTSGGQGGGFRYHRKEAFPVWLSIERLTGATVPDGTVDVVIHANLDNLPNGTYLTDVTIHSNDPATPVATVNASLNVSKGASSLEHNNGQLVFSVMNNGIIGRDYQGFGAGFEYLGENGIFDGKLLIAGPNSAVSGRLYMDSEFSALDEVDEITSPFDNLPQAFGTRYNDNAAAYPIGIEVVQESFSSSTMGHADDDYVLMSFNLSNHSGHDLDGVHVGIVMDFDIGDPRRNMGVFDASRKLTYVYDSDGFSNQSYYGLMALSSDITGHSSTISFSGMTSSPEAVIDSFYYAKMTTLDTIQTVPKDSRTLLAVGPFDIAVDSTVRVGFALLAGSDLQNLEISADRAHSIWDAVLAVDESGPTVPKVFALHQNYPNPFNPTSTIRFDLPEAASVALRVYDLRGREILVLKNDHLEAGYHQAVWNGRDKTGRMMSSGLYIARLEAGKYTKSIKMVMLK